MSRYVATIGMFDGMHRGHYFLIDQVKRLASERGLCSMLITMDNHPRTVLTGYPTPLLTPLDNKLSLMRNTNVDAIEVLHFNHSMASMSARDFIVHELRDRLNVKVLLMGYDHHFGHEARTATHNDYIAWGREAGIEVLVADELHGTISSSAVRRALNKGDVQGASKILGREYTLRGKVVSGKQIGRELGFPTANLLPVCSEQIKPADGVYAVRVNIEGRADNKYLTAMCNIGTRPTIDNRPERTIEVHILNYEGELYGKQLTLAFVTRIRDIMKFDSRTSLIAQLHKDMETASIVCNDR